jgi:hypothetical protein
LTAALELIRMTPSAEVAVALLTDSFSRRVLKGRSSCMFGGSAKLGRAGECSLVFLGEWC